MLKHQRRLLLLLLLLCAVLPTSAIAARDIDVVHYDVHIEPEIINKTVKGKVLIRLIAQADNLKTLEFDCGALVIDHVSENKEPLHFTRDKTRLVITLSRPSKAKQARTIEIEYHGAPRFGIRFIPDRNQVYTAFSNSEWKVCVNAPEDRATLRLNLVLPAKFQSVANGRFVDRHESAGGKIMYEWRQEIPVPSYTFGFAAGEFTEVTEKHGRVQLRYVASAAQFSEVEMRRIFRETGNMITFFENRAGVRYADKTYTQVLTSGGYGQEMSGFAVMGENYGRSVLSNESDTWLIAHELAHQWWGNMVTCRDWNHFWLNEGMANFMASAYKEQRFGRNEYLREIEGYRTHYLKVRDAGKDRSLVFPDWNNPTRDDRTLVYDKGAYVIHLLRLELGERAFWRGIRHYTRTYFGKSVTTPDFQRAMERASGKDLKAFFAEWVYMSDML